jgi:Ca2+-binding EF-hand superfamily protein
MTSNPKKIVNNRGNRFQSLSQEEYDEIKQAFELFDTNSTGRINPQELKQAMQSLGFDSRNPTIYDMICELDTPDAQRKGGIDIDQFVEAINNKLGDKETKEGIRRIFQLFVSDPDSTSITANDLKKIAKELGETMSKEDFDDMLKRASSSGHDLTFQEFYDIMTKKTFP